MEWSIYKEWVLFFWVKRPKPEISQISFQKSKGEVWNVGGIYEENRVEENQAVLAKIGVSVGAWLSWVAALLPGKGEESVCQRARPKATNPIT